MQVDLLHGSGLREIQTYGGLRIKDKAVQCDVISGIVHRTITLNCISC